MMEEVKNIAVHMDNLNQHPHCAHGNIIDVFFRNQTSKLKSMYNNTRILSSLKFTVHPSDYI